MRGYSPDTVIGAMDEVFRIAREAGVAALISHFNSRADLVSRTSTGRARRGSTWPSTSTGTWPARPSSG